MVDRAAPSLETALGSMAKPPEPAPGSSANLTRILAAVETPSAFFLFYPFEEYTLQDMIVFSPGRLFQRHTVPMFIIYQLLQTLRFCHEHGLVHGRLSPSAVDVDQTFWVRLHGFVLAVPRALPPPAPELEARYCEPLGLSMHHLTLGWCQGWISNFDYLMGLNYLAGRRLEDPNHHPVLPWVIDFHSPHGNPRDLTKTKYRLNKGDQQLDITFNTVVPHHISDILAEVFLC